MLDAASVRDAAAGCDGVFHCAGRVSRKPEDAEALQRVHVEGNKVTLDACKAAGVKRAVVASTSGTIAVSRDPDAVLDERAPEPFDLVAGWPYYRSKLYAERAALERSVPGFEVVCVNPSLLLGPVREGAVVAKGASSTDDVVDFLERRVPFVPAGNGISFVDAPRRLPTACSARWSRGRAGERYLLTGANMTLRGVLPARLARISGVPRRAHQAHAERLPRERRRRAHGPRREALRRRAAGRSRQRRDGAAFLVRRRVEGEARARLRAPRSG